MTRNGNENTAAPNVDTNECTSGVLICLWEWESDSGEDKANYVSFNTDAK